MKNNQNFVKVTYRDIARMLASKMVKFDEEIPELTDSVLESIRKLDNESKLALKTAMVWSSKVPIEEREDFFQDLFLTLYRNRVADERLAYSIARCDWKDFWKSYKTHSQFIHGDNLETEVKDNDGNAIQWGELMVGEAEFQVKLDAELDNSTLLAQFPVCFRKIIERRLLGYSITGGEKRMLDKWVATRPTCLVSAGYVK